MITGLETIWSMWMGLCLGSDSVDAPNVWTLLLRLKKEKKRKPLEGHWLSDSGIERIEGGKCSSVSFCQPLTGPFIYILLPASQQTCLTEWLYTLSQYLLSGHLSNTRVRRTLVLALWSRCRPWVALTVWPPLTHLWGKNHKYTCHQLHTFERSPRRQEMGKSDWKSGFWDGEEAERSGVCAVHADL